MRRVARFSLLVCVALATAAFADDPRPDPAVVTLRSGELSVELERSHAWNIRRISFRGVPVGTATGAYGTLVSIPAAGGWIGGPHTEGGVEQVLEARLIVDGEEAALEDGAEYTCERAVFTKRSMLDRMQLDATLTLSGGRLRQQQRITATEAIVVDTVYPLMYCLTAETAEWLGVTAAGEEARGLFDGSSRLQWHEDWAWTAAFVPESRVGVVLRVTRRPEAGRLLLRYWDQERYHKLYLRLDANQRTWAEGHSAEVEAALECFEAPPDDWASTAQSVARGMASE